jgi:hypothetical protein
MRVQAVVTFWRLPGGTNIKAYFLAYMHMLISTFRDPTPYYGEVFLLVTPGCVRINERSPAWD